MADLKDKGNTSKNVDIDVMVTNTLKKLALKKEKSNDSLEGHSNEVRRSTTSMRDFKKRFSSLEENQTSSSKSSSIPQSPTPTSVSTESEYRPIQQNGGTVDDMVTKTLLKLERKKSSVTSSVDTDHDKEGNVIRSKTSIAEFKNRFSFSSEHGKEGWNSLETTPIGKQERFSNPAVEKEIILEESNTMEYSLPNPNAVEERKKLNLSLSGTQDTRIKVNRKQSHPISQEQRPPQTLNHPSSPMLLSPSTNKGGGLIGIESYDKKRENTLNSIQRGIQSPVKNELESIVQTKINSINMENSNPTSPQISKTVVIPKPAPRKTSPKDHHAPEIPLPQSSANEPSFSASNSNASDTREISNLCSNKNDEIGAKYLSKNTSNTAPKPTRPGKVLPNKKGKINIQISNFESSGTNYSTLERKKF